MTSRVKRELPPIGVEVKGSLESVPNRPSAIRARVTWTDPTTNKRARLSTTHSSEEDAEAWITTMKLAAGSPVGRAQATATLHEYGEANMKLALRGLESKTTDPYLAGWRKRVVPTLGHIPVRMITYGAVDRAVMQWIADECGKSVVKNSLAVLVRVMEQAVRDGILDRNPARISGWQRQYDSVQDELDDPRTLALPNWSALQTLADVLVRRSAGNEQVWGDVVIFAGCTAGRIGEVSGCRVGDIDTTNWIWTVRRQTTTAPGGLVDKGTKGKRAREVPLIVEVRELIKARIAATNGEKDARLFTGPRGGRISTAVLRDATHWDEVVRKLGYDHLRRHDLRHTALTWFADAGVPVHHLQKIAGHGSITTTQRYLHPDRRAISAAGELLSQHLRAPHTPKLRIVSR